MKILKRIILVIAIIIAIPLLLALFVKKDYALERKIIVERPVPEVFEHIRYLENQDQFSKWGSMDPDMKQTYRGVPGTPGSVSAWDSEDKNVGKGEQEILAITENERIDYELRFIEPFASVSSAYFITEEISDNQTLVRWGFNGRMNYPMNLMLLFMDFEKMIGEDLELGLRNLKANLEK